MGPAMPHFSERATDGKVYSDRTIGSHGPVLVMFFEAGCPHTPHGIDAMNRLKKEIGNQVTLVGVVNLGIGQAKQFAAKHYATFPIIADADSKTISGFRAQASLDNALIMPKAGLVKLWTGYNQATLRNFEAEVKRLGGPDLRIDLAKFPTDRQSGCAFMQMKS